LLFARCRLCIKPLHVPVRRRSIAFASETRALVESRLVERVVDPAAVLGYLSWGSVAPSLTWIDGVENLAPGTWLRWSADGRHDHGTFADVASVYAQPPSTSR